MLAPAARPGRRSALLALALWLAGCTGGDLSTNLPLVDGGTGGDDGGGNGDSGIPDDPDAPLGQAFYMLQPEDLRGETHQGLPPADLGAYDLFVCNAEMVPSQIRTAAGADVTLLGYASPHQVPTWGTGELWTSYRALFVETDYWHVDGSDSGPRVSTWAGTEELRYTDSNARKLAPFLAQRWASWDGIYLDDLFGALAPQLLQKLPVTSAEWPQVQADWAVFRDILVTELRAAYPGFLVANSGYGTDLVAAQLPLDGVCAEEWWPTHRPVILSGFRQKNPALCVAWEWDPGQDGRRGNIRYR
jgi:hypothetical protein